MQGTHRLISGILINWGAFGIGIVVAFLLSPFVVHRLGNVAYGVWVLAGSSVGYMALLDLGLRGAVTHYVAKHHARGEHLQSSRAVSVALGFRVPVGVAIMIGSVILATLATSVFHIPSPMWTTAQWAIAITGLNLSVSLIVGVFGAVLTALQRFDLASGATIGQTLLNAVGTVWVLGAGYGIIPLAITQLAVTLVFGLVMMHLCFRVYPELRIGFRFLERKILKDLWQYSFYLLVIGASSQVIYYMDNIVVGAFLSAEAVTFYSIGGRFVQYLGELGASLAQTFMPFASTLGAQNRQDQLQRLLIQGTRAALIVSLPIGVILLVRGPSFIGLWMGQQYAGPSGRILRILLLSMLAIAGNRVAGNIVFGLGKHKPFALWQSCEAVANLAISIFLVRKIGLDGVAWGTVLPSLVSQFLLWPRYISSLLNLPVRIYIWEGWIRPVLAIAPFCLACIWTERYWAATGMVHFFLQISVILPLSAVGIILVFSREVKSQLQCPNSPIRRSVISILHRDSAS